MGLGVTASAIMNMLSYTLKDKNINIKLLKYKDQAESFIKSMKKMNNLVLKYVIHIKSLL